MFHNRSKMIIVLGTLVTFASLAAGCGSSASISVSASSTDTSGTTTLTPTLVQNMGTTLKTTLVAAGMSSADADTVVNAGVTSASAVRIGGSSKFSAVTIQSVTSVAPQLAKSTVAAFALLTSMSAADKATYIGAVIDGTVAAVVLYKDGTEDSQTLLSEIAKASIGGSGSVYTEDDLAQAFFGPSGFRVGWARFVSKTQSA